MLGGVVSMPGGVWSGGGLPARGGGGSPCQTPPPVNRMTDRCKNITLAKTSFRPVMNPYTLPILILLVLLTGHVVRSGQNL